MTEDALIDKLSELEHQLESKDREIIGYLQKIEQLEDTIMRLEVLIPDNVRKDSKKKGKKIKGDSKLAIELEEKEKQIREIKNKMGFLRKEKIQLQHELEKHTKEKNESTVIRIEEKKEPLEALVKELTLKINKQQNLINKLKEESKKEELDELNSNIADLKKELERTKSNARIKTEDLSKEIKILRKKLQSSTSGKKEKKSKYDKYQKKIDDLTIELNNKNLEIQDLTKSISTLEATKGRLPTREEVKSSEDTFKALSEDLQRKLNTSKKQIQQLQEQLKEHKISKAPVENESQQEIINELRSELERLRSQEQVKEEIEGASGQVQMVVEDDINLALRVRELKNLLEDLEKQSDQQRLEISQLRKKIAK
ncbi:MAG: hypothetical protein ACFFDO_06160 [Candidatus Thorarchaeota archaeon]